MGPTDLNLSEDDKTLVNDTGEVDSGDSEKSSKSKVISDEIPDDIADEKPSVRDALKHAFRKEKADIEKEDPTEKKPKEAKKTTAKVAVEREVSNENSEEIANLSSEKLDDKGIDTKTLKSNVQPPVGWTAEAKAKWSTLPIEIQESVAKREKEVSDGFKKYGEETARYKELESVLAPRKEVIRQGGASEAQTVNKLFQWMEALTHPNRDYAYEQLVQLGKNFGIEIRQPSTAGNTPANNQNISQAANEEIPTHLKQFMDNVGGKISNLERNIQSQKDQEARNYVDNWAKDKPHFVNVRNYMFSLLQNGAVPLKDGALDLDAAYDAAVYANPSTRELVRQEVEQRAVQEAKQKKDKLEAERLIKLKKAKTAGSSLSSRAPTGSSNISGNSKDTKPQSIRDSIRAAIQEVREN